MLFKIFVLSICDKPYKVTESFTVQFMEEQLLVPAFEI